MIRVAPIKSIRLKGFRPGGLCLLLVAFCAPVVCIQRKRDNTTAMYTTLAWPEKSLILAAVDNKSSIVSSQEKESLLLEPLVSSEPLLLWNDTMVPTKKQLRTRRRLGNSNFDQWKHMVDSYLEQPMKYWSVGQWVGLGVILFVTFCCILPWCRRYEYSTSRYNAGYRSVGVVPVGSVYRSAPPGYYCAYDARPGFSCGDALCFLCCLECCSRQHQQDGNGCCNLLCGLCCFEFCCRGGRDVGLNPQSVIY